MRTAVLVHGCHGEAADWSKIMFGTKDIVGRKLLGRAPRGILVAVELQAELVIWGGVSTMKRCFGFVELWEGLSKEVRDIAKGIDHYFDAKSRTTKEEIENAAMYTRLRDIERLVLVSSPTHIVRCYQTALVHLWNRPGYEKLWKNLCAFQSDTCYEGATPNDVVVFEPWHRPDRPNLHLPEIGKALLTLPPGEAHRWIPEIEEVIARHGGKI